MFACVGLFENTNETTASPTERKVVFTLILAFTTLGSNVGSNVKDPQFNCSTKTFAVDAGVF
jgi:hypothetical protein